MDIPKLIEDLTLQNKTIFIAGGYSIYKYFLDNFEIDEIFLSKIKDSVEVKKAVEPLYFPNIEDYGYKIVDKKDYEEFIAYVYKIKDMDKMKIVIVGSVKFGELLSRDIS